MTIFTVNNTILAFNQCQQRFSVFAVAITISVQNVLLLHGHKYEIANVRRVGLVVSTSDSRSGVAGASPDEGTNTPMRNILEQGVHSHVLR